MILTLKPTNHCVRVGTEKFRMYSGQTDTGINVNALVLLRTQDETATGKVINALDRAVGTPDHFVSDDFFEYFKRNEV